MHPMKCYNMAWGHSLLLSLISFKYLKTAERQGPQENILLNSLHQHTNRSIISTEIANNNRIQVFYQQEPQVLMVRTPINQTDLQ